MSNPTQPDNVIGSPVTAGLSSILEGQNIQPGDAPSYQLCKAIYTFHPLGARLVETPIKLAQTKVREIALKDTVGDAEIRNAFNKEWAALKADYYIRGCMYQARIYGVGTLGVGMVEENGQAVRTSEPLDLSKINASKIYFNVFDSMNTAGSLVLDQDPNSPTFQKHGDITANGVTWHRSRTCVMFNEQPLYISYTSSAFGFSGRSVFQRALYPLQSFINTMRTDDMVALKAGVLVAKMKQPGSIINKLMQSAASIKRALLKMSRTENVLSIDTEESIETLNMQNTDTALNAARSNILRNIAMAADMPAKILEGESFAEGFGEGSEDTKNIMRYVESVRTEMQPLYDFMDRICQRRAWNEEFFAEMKTLYPEHYGKMTYDEAYYQWQQAYRATWPSLLDEPESEKSKHDKVKLEGLISVFEKLMPALPDQENKAKLVEWIEENVNELPHLFRVPLALDTSAIADYMPSPPDESSGGGDGLAPPDTRPMLTAVK